MSEQSQKATLPSIQGGYDNDSFLSLREILQMVFRHKGKIAVFTLVVTAAAATFFFLQPRTYKAEGLFQVMPLQTQERVDRDLFENSILTHLEFIKSPLVAGRVAAELEKQGIAITISRLSKDVECRRPPKTSLICITASDESPKKAALIAQCWMDEYMKIVTENNIQKAMFNVRNLIKDTHDKGLEKMARAQEMRIQAEKIANDRLVTVSRSVDDGELWKQLAENADEAALKRLAGIQLKSEQINNEYLMVKNALLAAEQDARATLSHGDFYKQVIVSLKGRAAGAAAGNEQPGATNSSPEVESYIQTLLNASDIVLSGQAAMLPERRGALMKTAIAFAASLFAACMLAFLIEWLKEEEMPATGAR